MGVYIKGMDKPKFCGECPITINLQCLLQAEKRDGINDQYKHCPLVEVKAPHGMLIDAERLKEDIAEWGFIGESCAREVIDDAPIVIEAEVE